MVTNSSPALAACGAERSLSLAASASCLLAYPSPKPTISLNLPMTASAADLGGAEGVAGIVASLPFELPADASSTEEGEGGGLTFFI